MSENFIFDLNSSEQRTNNVSEQRKELLKKGWERISDTDVQRFKSAIFTPWIDGDKKPIEIYRPGENCKRSLRSYYNGPYLTCLTKYVGLVYEGCWVHLNHYISGSIIGIADYE